MAENWWTLYETVTGVVRAHTSVLPSPIPSGMTVIDHGATRMDQTNIWNTATRAWVPMPASVLVDRLQDLATHPYAAELWSRLTAPQRVKLRKLMVWLLGAKRYREPLEEVPIGVDPSWPTDPANAVE